eukprot:4056537-Prorocentrum_lima.AAC.1
MPRLGSGADLQGSRKCSLLRLGRGRHTSATLTCGSAKANLTVNANCIKRVPCQPPRFVAAHALSDCALLAGS